MLFSVFLFVFQRNLADMDVFSKSDPSKFNVLRNKALANRYVEFESFSGGFICSAINGISFPRPLGNFILPFNKSNLKNTRDNARIATCLLQINPPPVSIK